MSNNIKISYNINTIKYYILYDIQTIIFKWNGIIFGEFVRDTIITNYYSSLFSKKYKNLKNIWNEKIDPETLPRTTISNDVDICLYEETDSYNMMSEISNLINKNFGSSNVKLTKNFYINDDNSYVEIPSGTLQTYKYNITIGAIPYVFVGTNININLNIIVAKNKDILPPFHLLDFLCNGFIMKNHNIITLSACTGTELDKLNFLEKKEIEYKIIKDIVNFKTDYCIKFPFYTTTIYSSIKYNEYACNRIEKMMKQNKFWNINNMPITFNKNEKINGINCNCCVCHDNFKNKEKYISIPILDSKNKIIQCSHMHIDCLFKYLKTQMQNKIVELNENNVDNILYENYIFLKCPMRNKLDFNCKNITNIIENYLQT